MLLASILILILYSAETTWALPCLHCSRTSSLDSSSMMSISNTDECLVTSQTQYSSCSQLLHIDYHKNNASVLFEPSPKEILEVSNAALIMTNKTMIWLDKFQLERTFQILCFHANACKADNMNQIYENGKSSSCHSVSRGLSFMKNFFKTNTYRLRLKNNDKLLF